MLTQKFGNKNLGNCVPLIPYRCQNEDEHLLYLTQYIKWLFRIGKYNSKSSESGSISSLNMYRHRSVRGRLSNISDRAESFADDSIKDKITKDFTELFSNDA